MSDPTADAEKFRRLFLLVLTLAISIVFVAMVRGFLIALLVAAILSGMTHPLYRRFRRWFRGRATLASAATVLLVLLVIVVPLTGFLGIVAAEGVQVSQQVRPWVEEQLRTRSAIDDALERLPFVELLEPYREPILAKVGELASRLGTFVVNALTAAARQTATFFFLLFVMLYAMFFFLIDGRSVLDKILYYMPLTNEQESRMLSKFVSVARATIKGTLVIGVLQGGLAGLAFAVVGIGAPAFWGTIMAVLSIIPGLGTAIVWVPAVIYLFAVSRIAAAIGLLIWCGLLVGTVDNFLRPRLVGKDTKMPDLLILLGTLGGIVLFGAVGIVVGPIIAALFITVWDIYGATFREVLPPGPVSIENGASSG